MHRIRSQILNISSTHISGVNACVVEQVILDIGMEPQRSDR